MEHSCTTLRQGPAILRWKAMLNREMAFRKVALAQTAGAVSGTVVAVTVALAGGKVWSLVSGSITTVTVATLAIWIASPFRLKAVFRPSDARHMLSFGLKLRDRKSTRLNSSHLGISYAVFC